MRLLRLTVDAMDPACETRCATEPTPNRVDSGTQAKAAAARSEGSDGTKGTTSFRGHNSYLPPKVRPSPRRYTTQTGGGDAPFDQGNGVAVAVRRARGVCRALRGPLSAAGSSHLPSSAVGARRPGGRPPTARYHRNHRGRKTTARGCTDGSGILSRRHPRGVSSSTSEGTPKRCPGRCSMRRNWLRGPWRR